MSRSAARVSLVPTIAFIALFVMLHIARWFGGNWFIGYEAGGVPLAAVSFAALACGIMQAGMAHNPRSPSFTIALPPALVLLIGTFGVWWEMRAGRMLFEEEPIDPDDRIRVFSELIGESSSNMVLAAGLAAMLLAHASWLVSLRAKGRAEKTSFSRIVILTAVAAVGTSAGMIAWGANRRILGVGGGTFTIALTVLAWFGMYHAARSLSGATESDEQGARASWQDVLVTGLCCAGSVLMAGISGRLHAIVQAYDSISGESTDPASKGRILAEGWQLASDAMTLSLVAAACLLVMTLILLLARPQGARRQASIGALGLILTLVVAASIGWNQTYRLLDERWEYRQGDIGELVEDRTIEAGTLVVQLEPLVRGVDLGWSAEIKLSPGPTRMWNPHLPARFTGLASDRAYTLTVASPYLADPTGPFQLARYKGARIRIGVLRLAPQPRAVVEQERSEPEKILHVETIDPDRFRLVWAMGRIVIETRQVPRTAMDLASAVTQSWLANGSHKNDNDYRQDSLVLHYVEPKSLDSLVALASIATRHQRSFKGTLIPAFNVYVLADQPAASSIDEEVDPARLVSLPPEDVVERSRDAMVRCQGRPCAAAAIDDRYGVELNRACGQPLCSVATVAGLHLRLGEALATAGDTASATEAFRQANMLNPHATLEAAAAAPAWEALRAGRGLPLPRVTRGNLTVNGRLPVTSVGAVVDSRLGFYRACYGQALRARPTLEGRVSMRFVIGRDGVASEPGNGGSDLADPEVVRCVLKAGAGMTFPPPEGGIVTVIAPFMFSPR
jgi:hypothetical protein